MSPECNEKLNMVYIEQNCEEDPELTACRRLWTGVLIQAIRDLNDLDDLIRNNALYWIKNDSIEFTSFISVCDILEINYRIVRKKILKNNIIFISIK